MKRILLFDILRAEIDKHMAGTTEFGTVETLLPSGAVPLSIPITTFTPEPYRLEREIPATVQLAPDGFTAAFFDANIATSGETQEEAVSNLKSLILDTFDFLSSEPPEALGPEPARQLAVLRGFLERES